MLRMDRKAGFSGALNDVLMHNVTKQQTHTLSNNKARFSRSFPDTFTEASVDSHNAWPQAQLRSLKCLKMQYTTLRIAAQLFQII